MNRRELLKGAAGAALAAALTPAQALLPVGGSARAAVSNLLGVNAFDPVGYSSGPVWLNEMKHASSNSQFCPWFTGSTTFDTGEEAYLAPTLDSNYMPTTLTVAGIPGGQQFTKIFTYIFQNMPALGPNQTYQYPPGARTLGFSILGNGSATSIQFEITGDVSGLATTTPGVSVSGNTVTSTLAPGQSGTVTFNANNGTGGFVITLLVASSGISPGCYFSFDTQVRTSLLSNYNAGEIICPEYKAALQAGWNGPIRFMGAQKTFYQDWKLTFTGTVSGTSGGTISSIAEKDSSYTTWPFPTGTWPVIFATGQVIDCNFTYGSAAVTWSTALSSPVTTSAIAAMAMVPVHQPNWSSRALMSHMSWGLYKGLPLEALIIACNEIGLPPWACVPGCTNFTDTTWATNFAKLMKDGTGANIAGSNQSAFNGLNANLLARIEYTNECWGTYLSTNLVEMMSVPSGFYAAQSNNQFYGGQEWYGTQIAGIADAFSAVYGAGIGSRVRIIWSNQFATGNGVNWMKIALNTPDWTSSAYTHANGFGGLGVAPYFGTDSISLADATTIKALADPVSEILSLGHTNVGKSGNTYSSVDSAGIVGVAINTMTSILSGFTGQPWSSWPKECYEGGSAFDDSSNLEPSLPGWRVNVLNATQNDSRFQYLYYDPTHQLSSHDGYLPELKAAGISFICQLSMVGAALTASGPKGSGNWGCWLSPMQPTSPVSSMPPKAQGCIKYATA